MLVCFRGGGGGGGVLLLQMQVLTHPFIVFYFWSSTQAGQE